MTSLCLVTIYVISSLKGEELEAQSRFPTQWHQAGQCARGRYGDALDVSG